MTSPICEAKKTWKYINQKQDKIVKKILTARKKGETEIRIQSDSIWSVLLGITGGMILTDECREIYNSEISKHVNISTEIGKIQIFATQYYYPSGGSSFNSNFKQGYFYGMVTLSWKD